MVTPLFFIIFLMMRLNRKKKGMEFKKSEYYDEKFLGEHLYKKIENEDTILTVQEFFCINNIQNEYHIKENSKDYRLIVYDDHYELNCQKTSYSLFLVFDKPVHITGINCKLIIAPMIIIKSKENDELYYCVTNKVVIDNGNGYNYKINNSKVNNLYFYNSRVYFWDAEINNFFIFNKDLHFMKESKFLNYQKIKCFGECTDLKKKILKYKNFQEGTIHIE